MLPPGPQPGKTILGRVSLGEVLPDYLPGEIFVHLTSQLSKPSIHHRLPWSNHGVHLYIPDQTCLATTNLNLKQTV